MTREKESFPPSPALPIERGGSGAEVDVLVVGCGTMGTQALWRLASRGARVLGIEQFAPGHDRGSGHGESRIIRTAYYEGPQYVPLVTEAFGLWRRLEQETGARLLTMTGGLMIGRPDSGLVQGVLRSAREHGLAHEVLDARAVRRRYPQFRLDDDEMAVFEEAAGVLRPELAITTAARRAQELGAGLRTGTRVETITVDESGRVSVRAGGATFRARHLVVSGGAWNPGLLPPLGASITVERKVLTWFRPDDPALFVPDRFPIFIWEREGTQWYGIPSMDGQTVKLVVHRGGIRSDPDHLDREVHAEDLEPITHLVSRRIEGVAPVVVRSGVCMYSLSPDEHFMIGSPAGMPEITFLGGFSGHGFKFAPVIGDIAADLALERATARPIAAFDPNRFEA